MKRILITLAAALALAFASATQTGTAAKKAGAHKGQAAAEHSGQAKEAVGQGAQAAKGAGLIDINTATEDELKTVPGIGDAYAAKIVQGRPYRAKSDLVRKKILPSGVYAKVKDRLVARQQTKQ